MGCSIGSRLEHVHSPLGQSLCLPDLHPDPDQIIHSYFYKLTEKCLCNHPASEGLGLVSLIYFKKSIFLFTFTFNALIKSDS